MAQDFSLSFYRSRVWRKCRAAYTKSVNYTCEICGEPGDIVHHEERLTPENIKDPNVTLNWKKLKLVCIRCHNQIYNEPAVADGLMFDDDGNLIEAPRSSEKR